MYFIYRRALARTRVDNTEAEVGIEFNNTASQAQIPQADTVVQTLVNAVSNSSNTFNISIVASTITAVGK